MKQKVLAVVGGKKVGKTTTTESLIAELTKRGYKVAAIKHISEPEWTIDTSGKDTYRFAQHGARTVIAVAAKEIVTIEKNESKEINLRHLLKKAPNFNVILTEGLKKEVARKKNIPKIAVVTSKEEAEEAIRNYSPILAFSGPYNPKNLTSEIPYADALKEPTKLADIAESFVRN